MLAFPAAVHQNDAAAITVILNAAAGSVRSPRMAADITELFRATGRDARVVILRARQSPIDAARDASANSRIVVASGGDGTVSSVVAGIVGTSATLGVLPTGTLNHFARDLHIPLDLEQAVATIVAGHVTRVDVGQVNDRVFVNNSSIGVYPGILEVRDELRRQGHRKWPAMALATLRVLRRYRGVHVNVEIDGRLESWRTPLLFVGNNEYAMDGIRLGARPRLDAGRLYAYIAPPVHARALPMLVARALLDRSQHHGDFTVVAASELWIGTRRGRRLRVALDGELTRMTSPLHYRTLPKALPVIVPHG
jgi:diacylglycerol kinase family enzyme